MRVIHYIGSFGFGGIERLVFDLVSQQKKRDGLDVAIGVSNLNGEFKHQFENLNILLQNFSLNSGFDLNPIKIIKIVKHFNKFDVIHVHGFHLSIALAAFCSGRKIIYTEHGNFGFGRKIKNADTLSFILRKLFFKYKKVIICCNSNFTKKYVKNKFYNGKRLKLIYNGSSLNNTINENLKQDLKQKYGYDTYIVGTSSRLAGFKRIDRLISVFSEFIKSNPNSLLVIVGEGIERSKLEKQALELEIEKHIIFEGFKDEVATYQSVFDVCVFPSLNEPFGLVAVECYTLKKPVLVFSDGGGLVEIINRIEPQDVCLNPKEMIKRMKHYQKKEFKWDNHFTNQLEFFSLQRMEQDYYKEYIN